VKKFLSLLLSFAIGAFFGAFAGIPVQTGVAFVGMKLATSEIGVMPNALYNAIDVSAVTAYADEHKRSLIATLVNGLDIAKDITVIPNVKNKIALTKLTVGDGFRPYSNSTEFKSGQLGFSDRYLETLTGKRELLLDIRDFKNKHLAWRTSPGNRASKTFQDMEFAPFVWAEVIKGLQREINDEVAYFGFDKADAVAYDIGDPYAVGDYVTFAVGGVTEYFLCTTIAAAGDTPTTDPDKWRNVTARAVVPGLKYYIDELIADGFAPTTTGAISSGATAVTAFKKMYRDHSAAEKRNGIIIHCSFTDSEYLLDGMEDLYKYTTPDISAAIAMGLIPIPGTNGKGFAKPSTWLGTSRRLISEPLAMGTGMGLNLVMGTDLLSDANDIKTKENLWTTEAGILVDLGFNVQDAEALRLGDQA
jgi:hypothetical protein